jgi:hypothetical protein
LNIAQYLVKKGADVNVRDIEEWTPLHWAAENGHLEWEKAEEIPPFRFNKKRGSGEPENPSC